MAQIRLENLVKRFGKQTAVENLSLEIEDKEFIALLGPSGCGKTTTMNMISGLLQPDSGKIYFDDQEVNEISPGKRGVGFMFQNYAVFTHMNVFKNISFGLEIQKIDQEDIERQVREVADLLQIGHLLRMNASKLSINDMQKVALARSMVTEPRIFLLDEPLSNLDAALRSVMRVELKRIQREIGQTTVYVTHDQVEAMSLADRIAVMNFAVLQQYDTPHNVYNFPKNIFVANFLGSPTINFIEGVYKEGIFHFEVFSNGSFKLSAKNKVELEKNLKNERIVLGIRPEHMKLSDLKTGEKEGLRAKVISYEPLGSRVIVYLQPDQESGVIIKSSMEKGYKPRVGDIRKLNFTENHIYVFDKESTALIKRFTL